MRSYLRLLGYSVGLKRVRRLMRLMGLIPIYQKPRTTNPHPEHRRYPYLLRGLVITAEPGLVLGHNLYSHAQRLFIPCGDYGLVQPESAVLTDFQHHGHGLLCAALEEALAKHGKPGIFNTDQGSQFTSFALTNVLRTKGIRISMDAVATGLTTCLSSGSGAR